MGLERVVVGRGLGPDGGEDRCRGDHRHGQMVRLRVVEGREVDTDEEAADEQPHHQGDDCAPNSGCPPLGRAAGAPGGGTGAAPGAVMAFG
jgi:hypothetical protein